MPAPTLPTERLLLRAHRLEDWTPLAAVWADPIVTRHIGGRPSTGEEAWSRLLRYAGHWALLGFGYWAVEERESGRYAGEVGLADFRRDVIPSLDGLPEAGWVLAPWAHGRGLATEAVRAVLAWADATLAAPRTSCIIDPGNLASLRVASRCGFVERARGSYHGEPSVVLDRPRGGTVAER